MYFTTCSKILNVKIEKPHNDINVKVYRVANRKIIIKFLIFIQMLRNIYKIKTMAQCLSYLIDIHNYIPLPNF